MRLQNLFMPQVKLECFKANGKKEYEESKYMTPSNYEEEVSKQPCY